MSGVRSREKMEALKRAISSGFLTVDSEGRVYSQTGREIRGENVEGYLRIDVTFEKKRRRFLKHVVVWVALFGEPPEDMEINHKDGKRDNCHPNNLELLSKSRNILHRFRELGKAPKLTLEKAQEIRAQYLELHNYTRVAEKFEVSPATVSDIVNGRTWKALD